MKYVALAGVLLLFNVLCIRADDAPPADEAQMQTWWDDLEKNEPACSRALLKLADHPAQSIALFKERLKPLAITEERVKSLLAELGSDEDKVWKPAFEKLEYFDPRLAIDLNALMNENLTPLARTRLVEILSGYGANTLRGKLVQLRSVGSGEYNFVNDTGSWWAEYRIQRLISNPKWTRTTRAIVVLEHIGSPEAAAILRDISTGHPDAEPTKAAREALEKIEPAQK